MPLSDLRGQDRAVAFLKKLLSGGRVHHAYLFTGEAGSGADEAALAFAQALNCGQDPDGCGVCNRCGRIARGLHPDVLRLARDPESAGREIRVEPLRDLCAALQLSASEGAYKVAIIQDADQLNPSAQNALLKTLEEPPPRTVLILVTALEDRLLPTVRSRCLRVGFALPSVKPPDVANRSRTDHLVDELSKVLLGRQKPEVVVRALAFAERFGEDRERAIESTFEATLFLRDLLRVISAGEGPVVPLAHDDKLPQLRELATRLSPVDVLDGLEALKEATIALQGNGAPRLQLEAVALKLGQVA